MGKILSHKLIYKKTSLKSFFSLVLLCIFLINLFKPVLPLFIDIAQHVFNYSEHISTVHFENGQFHVHNELKESSKKDNAPKEANNLKKDSFGNEYLQYSELPALTIYYTILSHKLFTASCLFSTHLSNDYPPPKA